MSTRKTETRSNYEGRLALAIKAYEDNKFKSYRAAAAAYNVCKDTLSRRLRGGGSHQNIGSYHRKLSDIEETALTKWILDIAARGHPVRFCYIEIMANQLLSTRCGSSSKVGKRWTERFVARNSELQTQRYRKYDYERALCEDPRTLQQWFDLARNTIAEYGIPPSDIWNFDESGFAIGVLGLSMIVTGIDSTSKQTSIQAGNREWTTTIDAINAEGAALPPMIIFKGKLHQAAWYESEWFDPDWSIGLSDSGWTTDTLGLKWLREVFDPHSNKIRQSTYRLLIMDGHRSHETPEFDAACRELNIIPIYMPPHSSHLLQPLDVGVYSPLKRAYTKELKNTFRLGINHVDKLEFLEIYKRVRPQVFTQSNILEAFKGTGLYPFDPSVVLNLLNAPLGPTTPENEPAQAQQQSSPWAPQTPHTIKQLDKQKQALNSRLQVRARRLSSPTQQILDQVVKACQTAMTGATILATENQALHDANQKQKRKRASERFCVGEEDVISGRKGQDRAKRARANKATAESKADRSGKTPSTRAPPKCSICGTLEHNARVCPDRYK